MNRRIQRTDPLQNQSSVIERKIESLNKLAFLDCTIFTLVHLPFAIARSLPGSENHEIDTISNITMWIGSCIYPFIYISHWPNLKQNWKKLFCTRIILQACCRRKRTSLAGRSSQSSTFSKNSTAPNKKFDTFFCTGIESLPGTS